jgi:hypothetical protein
MRLYRIEESYDIIFLVAKVLAPGGELVEIFDGQDYGSNRRARSAAEKLVAEENVKLLLEENKGLRDKLKQLEQQSK